MNLIVQILKIVSVAKNPGNFWISKSSFCYTEELPALKKDVDMLKTQGYNPGNYAPTKYGCKSYIEQIRQCQHCFKCGTSGHKGEDCKSKKPDHWWQATNG